MAELDYLADIHRESTRFHAVLSTADPGAPVQSCPGWTAEDLLWHLTEVQTFWGSIVRERRQEFGGRGVTKPDVDYQGLLDGFAAASAALQQALAQTPVDVPVWTWADDQTAGFVRRRQAQEVLIHRLDAELLSNATTPLDPTLASDGVDEILTVMYGARPAWTAFAPSGHTGRILATDTGTSWDLRPGRSIGTDPGTGETHDRPAVEVSRPGGNGAASFTVTGSAAQLDAWLWRREVFGEPVISGDPAASELFLAVLASGIR